MTTLADAIKYAATKEIDAQVARYSMRPKLSKGDVIGVLDDDGNVRYTVTFVKYSTDDLFRVMHNSSGRIIMMSTNGLNYVEAGIWSKWGKK